MSRHILVCMPIVFCLLLSPGASAAPFSTLIIFGDSLSDVGNFSVATAGTIPGDPYFQGRFSNGANYAERLAAHLALGLAPSLAGGTNFAFGSARTNSHPFDQGLSLLEQVEAFTTQLGDTNADPEALYVVFAGANNLQDALRNPGSAQPLVLQAVTDIASLLTTLASKGVRHVLVPNLPNLGLVPRVTELEAVAPGISALATYLTEIFNTYLAITLNTLLETFPNLNLFRFDTFALLQEVVASPAAFGLTNVIDRCYTGDDLTFTGGGTICDTPETFLFWDGIHPTATAHTLLGNRLTEAIGLTRFDTFRVAKLKVAAGAFAVNGRFTPGAEGDGIDPVNEEVTLKVGTYVVMLPPGSFTSRPSHGVVRQFKFAGFIDGGALEVRLYLLGDDFFTFKIEGAGNPVSTPGDPLGVTFIIGNDTGVTSVFVDSHWGSHHPRR